MHRKTLVFGKSPGPSKKKGLVNLAQFALTNKTKSKPPADDSDKKSKKTTKTKKKKKLTNSKGENTSKEESSKPKTSEYSADGRLSHQKPQLVKNTMRSEAPEKSKVGSLKSNKKPTRSKEPLQMSLYDVLQASAIMIQKNVRGYLCRQRLGRFLQSVLESAQSEGVLGERTYSGDVTPLLSQGIPIKAIDSEDSQSSSIAGKHGKKTSFEDHSLGDLGIWKKGPIEVKTEYRDSTNSNVNPKPRTLLVKRPTKKIDVGVQAEQPSVPSTFFKDHKSASKAIDNIEPSKSKNSLPAVPNKKVVAVGTQVSFRAIDQSPLHFSSLMDPQMQSMKNSKSSKPEENSGVEKLESFAKDEYKKWGQVDHLLARLNQKLGKNSTKDVKQIFEKIEELANQSKYSIKNKFHLHESQHSLLSLSKTPTVQSLQQEPEKVANAQPVVEAPRLEPKRTISRGNSPIGSPLLNKAHQMAIEKWPETVDILKSMNFSEGRLSENPLFESIDERLDRFIQKEQKVKVPSMKWSGRCDVELSESVLRSVASEKEISLIMDQNLKLPSNRALERVQSKESFVGPLQSSLGAIFGNPDPVVTSGTFQRINTPVPTEISDMSPFNESYTQIPKLIKSKSKKTVIGTKPPEKYIPPTECCAFSSYLESYSQVLIEREKTQQSLDEINIALQTILDDLVGDSSPADDLLDASTKRLEGSCMWNIDSPISSARKKASDHTLNLLSDLVLQYLVQETVGDRLWKAPVAKLKKKKGEEAQGSLADKFKKIDELLSYDDKPVPTIKAEVSTTPTKQENPKKFNGYPENILDDNIEEDVGKSEDAQSEAETVYGIRTNFNAVNEYLNLLLKFLRERLPELKLPQTRHSQKMILKRIHNLETELRENANRNVPVKTIAIPKRPGKKERSSVNCFARKEDYHLPLPAQYFTTLEEDILVSLL